MKVSIVKTGRFPALYCLVKETDHENGVVPRLISSPEKSAFFGMLFPASTLISEVISCCQSVSSLLSMEVSSGSQQVVRMELL